MHLCSYYIGIIPYKIKNIQKKNRLIKVFICLHKIILYLYDSFFVVYLEFLPFLI